MKLSDLMRGIEYTAVSVGPDIDIDSVSSDSAKVEKGYMYVCIKGMHLDGHDFISEAVKNGACVIAAQTSSLSEFGGAIETELLRANIPLISIPDTRAALPYIFSNLYGNPQNRLKLALITGTNGKTTVSYMLSEIFSSAGYKTGIIGTLSGSMTTPDPDVLYRTLYDYAESGLEYVIMEASSHALALGKLAPLAPDIGIITNITPEHLDFHRDMQSYKAAKAKLFKMCKTGFFNMDDPLCLEISGGADCLKRFFSLESDSADFIAKNAQLLGCGGSVFDFFSHSDLFRVRLQIPGSFNISNALAAASAAFDAGVSPDIIKSSLSGFSGVKGRLERIALPLDDVSVYIDFAHTPDALLNLLKTVRGFMQSSNRLVLLFGCGGDRDRSKRPVMGKIAVENADFTIITSDNCRTESPSEIISEILSGVDKACSFTVIENRRAAIRYAIMNSLPGDVIVLAGKGHEEYEIVGTKKSPFSEREIALSAAIEKHDV